MKMKNGNIKGNIYQHSKEYIICTIGQEKDKNMKCVMITTGGLTWWFKEFEVIRVYHADRDFKTLGNSKLLLIVNNHVEKR